MIGSIESSTTAYSLEDMLSKIVQHNDHTKQIGPVEREQPVVKQSYGEKK
jgi:hypothetical protein